MGGGGNNDEYSQKQAQQEASRQTARSAINAQFGVGDGADIAANKAARESLYNTVRDNAFAAGKRGFDEHRDDAGRNLKFELFAKGLNGGSVDVDQNATLGRTYNQGLLDLGAKADAAKADLRSSDEQTRLGLLQAVDSGVDQNSALSSALNQMQVNNDKASAAAQGASIGDMFADSALVYNTSQRRLGQQSYQPPSWMTGYGNKPRGSTGSNGVITPT